MAPSKQDTKAYIKTLATPPPAGSPYALPIPGTERPNRTPIYRHWRFQNGPLLETFDPNHRTIHDLFEHALAHHAKNRCLGWRAWNPATQTWAPKYSWITYAEVAERRKNLGAGIVELHHRIGVKDDKYAVGLWAQNRPEWQITELALLSQSLWPVSLYETLGPEATEYIINHSGLSAIACSLPHIPTLLKLAPRVPSLKLIISLDPLDAGEMAGHSKLSLLNAAAANVGIQIFSMTDVEAIGARSGRAMRPPKADDVLTINYTSGTTGDPKGVLLTHANGVAGISAARTNESVQAGDVHISYLPLAHIYGRMADQTALAEGASIGYFHGDIANLVEDIKLLKPSCFMSVPRLYNRFNSAIQASTVEADGFKGTLSRHIIDSKKASMKLPHGAATNKHFLYDRIWTPKVLQAVGLQRTRTMVSGSAQLDPDVHEFLRAAFGNNFVQGFGMTETYAVGTVQAPNDFTTGNIGAPCPSIELCIESVPDYEYTVEDKPNPRGELLMRGPLIFKEYFRNTEETAKTIEADGWFHTGDIVEVDSMGRFKIIDRKKNVLKLAQGEYISPERIENVYMGSTNLIAMAFVHGEPKESSLVAVFGVDPVNFAPYASKILKKAVPADDKEALRQAANDPRVKGAFLKQLDQIGKSHKFNSFEKVKNCYLDIEPFSIENELLTPTLKLKRPQTARAFRAEIDRIPGLPPPRPPPRPPGAGGPSSQPPPAKRPRLDPIPTNDNRYIECLRKQVFPHIDSQIAALPRSRVNTLAIGKQRHSALDSARSPPHSPKREACLRLACPCRPSHATTTPTAAAAAAETSSCPVSRLTSAGGPRDPSACPAAISHQKLQLAASKPPPVVHHKKAQENPPRDWGADVHASVWRGSVAHANTSRWLTETRRRPYLTAAQRASVFSSVQSPLGLDPADLARPVTVHVDFTTKEFEYIDDLVRRTLMASAKRGKRDPRKGLAKMLKYNRTHIPTVLDAFVRDRQLSSRTRQDKTQSDPVMLTLKKDDEDNHRDAIRSTRLQSLLLAREVCGHRGVGSMRSLAHFTTEFRKHREDALQKRAEWTGCAGDIMTVVWVSNNSFICGTTEHSDAHNQQYNKPGNLVLGSCSGMTLQAYPEHRIVRPVVERGDNATFAMRESQDPWLYSSVVSSDFDAAHDRAFTSSFDRTVKIWKVEPTGASMVQLGEWKHDGNVNFVAASKHPSGMVATAADVAADAIRIYCLDGTDISASPYRSYSCSRVTDDRGNTVSTEKWAYYPATMQWGLAEGVRQLLLLGYSPRSRTGDDNDIPVERRDSGELLLWDGLTGERWNVTSVRTQNVFEVLWHPSQECFIAATSPLGLDLEPSVRTQIRIFRPADQNEFCAKAFSPIMTLDCTAIDINELTIMPISFSSAYITAGCTDGNTYVWDTARGDKPIHILRHGKPIDEYHGDREQEDVGVKFTAWGTTLDRFYTGSSDGVVKVWNVRSPTKPLVRHLLEAPAPITAGMFCPDKSRLVLGDGSGRVFMLSIEEEKEQPVSITKVPIPSAGGSAGGGAPSFRTIRRPPAISPHPDPPPPTHDAEGRPIAAATGPLIGRALLVSGRLKRHPDPTIGVVQGPRYAETGLFRADMHYLQDPAQPLVARWEATQQEARKMRPPPAAKGEMELDVEGLEEGVRRELERGGVDWELMGEFVLREEEE
ncbi:hypothetical protein C8A05DRAFT_41220 [Staphylotrichum tortipilum]|uniref:AMP-dependent synthetase/ligase domain-containing protein n=1 Tax=Staphylotrichum tortipilum TaxID=2831512 RepID=A0AAN6RXL0_9PEZI|nr:hypothetical protein C8A05DRAFT_41220 [Staphylotrichum longicolle]